MIGAMSIVSCAPFQHKMTEINSRYQLEEYRENLANGFFETVILKGRQVVEKDEETPPADAALYALGEAYAHYAFEGRDYVLSQYYFEKLIENFPNSQLVSEAKLYINLLETIAAREKTVVIEKAKTRKNTSDAVHVTVPNIVPRKVVENLDFEEAARKNNRVLDKAGKKKPADVALYNLGLIYAHDINPAKDYEKSQNYFQQLVKQFPDSELTEEALIWLGLFETIEKMQQIDIEIDLQKKQLTN
jgi:outer membrane protein assembly factor BamD (BamD/ComL family)